MTFRDGKCGVQILLVLFVFTVQFQLLLVISCDLLKTPLIRSILRKSVLEMGPFLIKIPRLIHIHIPQQIPGLLHAIPIPDPCNPPRLHPKVSIFLIHELTLSPIPRSTVIVDFPFRPSLTV